MNRLAQHTEELTRRLLHAPQPAHQLHGVLRDLGIWRVESIYMEWFHRR